MYPLYECQVIHVLDFLGRTTTARTMTIIIFMALMTYLMFSFITCPNC